MGFNCLVSF
ncbi:rCG44274 [Rattus norvegicus]|uniref:RCG44274 n=1 Tax=Rattus norvegicus TaxID=10116 RepID=A6KD60_RAT|nr:rCG44274 [Rattus norvegicus]